MWLYNLIYGRDRTSAYTGAAGSRYQSISDLTQHINEWNVAWPQHRELYALLFARFGWSVSCSTVTTPIEIWGLVYYK